MVGEFITLKMETNMKGNGKMVIKMAMEIFFMQMEQNMKENGKMTR